MNKTLKSSFQLTVLVAISLIVLQACVFAPAIDSFKRAGFTKADRAKLLGEKLKKFHEALYWRSTDESITFVKEDKKEELVNIIRKMSSSERTVDAKVDLTTFSDDGYEADIKVKVRAFQVPYYTVKERYDEQHWIFDFNNGWLLSDLERGEASLEGQ